MRDAPRCRLLRAPWLAAVLTAAALLTACGDSGSVPAREEDDGRSVADVLAQVEGLGRDERTARLLELVAEEDGELSFYSAMSATVARAVSEAFAEAYDIDVGVYRAQGGAVVERLLAEAEAGYRGADVVHGSQTDVLELAAEGLLAAYDSPARAALPEEARGETYTGVVLSRLVLSWNTELVAANEVPTRWEDLADPRWKGRLALDPTDYELVFGLTKVWEEQGKDGDEIDGLLEDIAANAVFFAGHTLQAQLVAAGEYALGVNISHIVDRVTEDGAPIAWRPPVEPAIANIGSDAILESTRHPAAAVLFLDWLIGEAGPLLEELRAVPILSEETAAVAYHAVDGVELAASIEEWTDRYASLVELGTIVEGEGDG